jgi:hypothetical protein
MHVANRNESVSFPHSTLSRWPDDDPRGSPFIFKPVAVLACLRRPTRVSAQSLLTAVTPARESLGSDLSRAAGDYTPRDKPICAIRWAPCASNDLPLGKQEMNMAFVASVDPEGQQKWRWTSFRLPSLFHPFPSHPLPCLLSVLLGPVTSSRVP